jgi:hypothetical protein
MKKKKAEAPQNCESCVWYDYNDVDDAYECGVDLDEDELARFMSGNYPSCPYFRFFDEYKMVQKQN